MGLDAGLDLEMPGSSGENDKKIAEAVNSGFLSIETLDLAARRVVELILKSQEEKEADYKYNAEAHHALARRAAAESAVLLKNDGSILPLKGGAKVAVIGLFAKTPRYQGSGSSNITPSRIDSPYEELVKLGFNASYADGTDLSEVKMLAAQSDAAVIFAGLPDAYESEGFDRNTLSMPQSHIQMIEAAASANPNAIVVLIARSPIALPWAEKAKAILLAYLGGQAVGGGIADLLSGKLNPCGKLAESWPLSIEDTPCFGRFATPDAISEEYRESIFVGYRYYDAAKKPLAYPFGYGLSYTRFSYSDLSVNLNEASVRVTNYGNKAGAEITQLYVKKAEGSKEIFRPEKELKGFEKAFLQSGESKTLKFPLDSRSFAFYSQASGNWAVEGGRYEILIGSSSRDIKLSAEVEAPAAGDAILPKLNPESVYFNIPEGSFEVSDRDFEEILGDKIPPRHRSAREPYTVNSTIGDIKDNFIGRIIGSAVKKQIGKMLSENADDGGKESINLMFGAMIAGMPLRSISMMSGGALPRKRLEGIVDLMNHKFLKGLGKLLAK
ncbi:MAG: glycoside hydrolase family 3 C-terminal domain-containing protein [Clostridiales bacterium]|jgi:beta-glucosidase|nr:glycoside hydrolase family 3 C-terminal domain-containing protein [Clostridiales bacterium]